MKVVHTKRTNKPHIYIGRPSLFGNPFAMRSEADRDKVIEQYREYFINRVNTDSFFRTQVLALTGNDLGCWCAPKACHGDIIVAWLNEQEN